MDSSETESIIISPASSKNETNNNIIANGQRTFKFNYFLEFIIFCIFLASNLSGTVYQNQILYQTCRSVYNYTDTQCTPLMGIVPETEESEKIEMQVQPYAANLLMTKTLIDSVIPSVLSLFIGPWSDKFGRKPVITTIYLGYFLTNLTVIVITFLSLKFMLNPWTYLIASIPMVLSGGMCSLITVQYCYLSDIVKGKGRAVRMVLLEAFIYGGISLGSFLSSYLYAATNVLVVFSISTSIILISLLCVIFFLPESLEQVTPHTGSKLRDFFRFGLIKDLFKTCFERRSNYDRAIIWMVVLSLSLSIAAMEGEATVTYLFVRQKFHWTLKDFNQFCTISVLYQVCVSILSMVILRKIFKFQVASIALLAFASAALESLVKGLAEYSWQMYLALGFAMFKGIGSPMCRAIISHVTPPKDLGKIFAITTSVETMFPLASAPLYASVYNATISKMPGAFNFISTGLAFICYTMLAIVFGIKIVYPDVPYDVINE